ncbi:MAG: glycosyltransferase family 4 protein [Acidobacteriota bacterium]|nr:glycosyltransferase family 4 protein [Acidobacteriota bacterium]
MTGRYPPVFSGASAQQHELLNHLGTRRVKATVLTLRVGELSKRETIDGVSVLRRGSGKTNSLDRFMFAVSVFLYIITRRRQFDAIHAFTAGWAAFLLPVAALIAGVRCVYTSSLQGSDDAAAVAAQGMGWLKVRLLRMFDAVVIYTPHQARSFVEAGFNSSAMHAITCGVDDGFYTPVVDAERRRTLRNAAGRDDDGPVVLFIGTVTARKGVDLLVESFRLLLSSDPAAVLVLMGPVNRSEDPTLDELFVETLRERSTEPELANHIVFLGRVDSPEEKRAIIRASDVFALFSQREGLGIVILEAMACGVPAVLTPIPGVFDFIITNGRDGRIAGTRDPKELAKLLHDVISSESRSNSMGQEARRTIEQRFSTEQVAQNHLDLYWALAARGRGS